MTVSKITPVNNYVGNNSNKIFDFDFLIENEKELLVVYTDKNGVSQTLVNGVDYSISEIGNPNGSHITFPLPESKFELLKEDENISLSLSLEIKQESKFENSATLNLKILEWTFDYIVRILQMLDRRISRAVKVHEGSNQTADDLISELMKAQINAKNSSDLAVEKANEVTDLSAFVREQTDKVCEEVKKIQPAKSESAGIIKPDNKTTFTEDDGTLHSPKYNLFDLVQKDHILSFEEKEGLELLGDYVYKEAQTQEEIKYGYPEFYNKCLAEYGEAEENTEEIAGITIKIHSNGHKYYNISDKEKIDEIYKDTGVAWYYGVDEANQRILLPRNDWFFQNDSKNVGKYQKEGLPDHTHFVAVRSFQDGGTYAFRGATDTVTEARVGQASVSNSIYGASDTVQPRSLKVLYYMVVGNTTEKSAEIKIPQITEGQVLDKLNNCINKNECPAYIKKFYINQTEGYVLYSNNLCVQWGQVGAINTKITLIKPYKSADYNITLGSSIQNACPSVTNVNEKDFTYTYTTINSSAKFLSGWWQTIGYVE